jgi:hypothetical protein
MPTSISRFVPDPVAWDTVIGEVVPVPLDVPSTAGPPAALVAVGVAVGVGVLVAVAVAVAVAVGVAVAVAVGVAVGQKLPAACSAPGAEWKVPGESWLLNSVAIHAFDRPTWEIRTSSMIPGK